jgi:hypothetical protein
LVYLSCSSDYCWQALLATGVEENLKGRQ